MAKRYCSICGEELKRRFHIVPTWTELKDGNICLDCLSAAGISLGIDLRGYTKEQAVARIQRRKSLGEFHSTKKAGGILTILTSAIKGMYKLDIDEDKELFRINGNIYDYSNLQYFQLLQDDVVYTEKAECEKVKRCWTLKIEVGLRDSFLKKDFILFLNEKHHDSEGNRNFGIKTKSEEYRKAAAEAWECMDALQVIADINKYREPPRPSPDPAPAPDLNPETAASGRPAADQTRQIRMNSEILDSYRKLLDAGLITEEEFKAKEKEILGR